MLYAYHAFQGLAHLESPKRDAGLDFMRQHVPRHVWFCPAIRWDDPNFSGTKNGSVTAFAIQPDGGLKFLNVINSQDGGPAHLSVDPSGKWVFAANYGTGTVVVTPKKTDGSLGDAADVQSIPTSPLGPHQAQDGPRYRFADSGHDAPHSHMTQTNPAAITFWLSHIGKR